MKAVEISLQLPAGGECPECLDRLRGAVGVLPGVFGVSVNSERQSLSLDYDPGATTVESLSDVARRLGADITRRYAHETLQIEGMDCGDCALKLESAISRLPGVQSAAASFAAGSVAVEFEPDRVSRTIVVSTIRELGYDVAEPAAERALTTAEFRLTGLDCADCARHVEQNVRELAGVAEANVNFASATLTVRHDGSLTTEQIIGIVRAAGYDAHPLRAATRPAAPAFWLRSRRVALTAAATLLTGIGFVAERFAPALPAGFPSLAIILFAVAIALGGFHSARAGLFNLVRTRSTDMNFLMTVAVVGAAIIGEWSEAATVVVLFAVGTTLEGYTMDRARGAVRALLEIAPREATVRRDGREQKVAVELVRVGELVIVRPGERVSVDGRVRAGSSSIDQSPVTGESIPVEKAEGDEVFAGTMNGRGYLEILCERPAGASTIAQVARLVEQSQAQRSESERFVDRFARYYTPLVLGIAALIVTVPWLAFGQPFTPWFYRALVLLVIACPCALVISTPVSVVSALARAAGLGTLVKGGQHLEEMARVRVVAFDKTGTLTVGRPEVTDVVPLGEARVDEVLRVAAAVEGRSEHPLAAAVLRHAAARGPEVVDEDPRDEVYDFESITGQGVRASLGGVVYSVGSPEYLARSGLSLDDIVDRVTALRAEGKTVLVVGEREPIGIIAVADRARPGARAAVARLREAGVERVVMLTGDHADTAQAIAREVGVDEFRAGLLPQDKVDAVRALRERYGTVVMVGDGINDAPALVAANIGIAMGAAGTDAALEAADVALMSDDLGRVASTVRLANRTMSTIRQNVAFSLGLKLLFVVATVPGFVTLWLAIFADTGASLIVTLNGMRLLRFRD